MENIDIIVRLRTGEEHLMHEAADEIERLRGFLSSMTDTLAATASYIHIQPRVMGLTGWVPETTAR